MPISCILLHEMTGADVVGVDIDERAVRLARDLLAKVGLNNRITIETSLDGIELRGDEVVWIASLVQGKTSVFSKIKKDLNKVQFM